MTMQFTQTRFTLTRLAQAPMTLTLLALVLMLSGTVSRAQPADGAGGLLPDQERARIQAERDRVEARFTQDEVACYQKFAVTDCLVQARVVRREAIADLRRQELSLNAEDALRKGAEQLRRIEEKSSAQAMEDEAARRAQAQADQAERQRVFDEKAAERARASSDTSARTEEADSRAQRRTQAQTDRAIRATEALTAKQKYDQKQKEAQERQAQQKKRLAEQSRPPASKPLPTSPTTP